MQVPDMPQFIALSERVDMIAAENEFLKSLLLGERWLTRKQAMAALGCKDDKLRHLTLTKRITYRYEGKAPFYEAFSIRTYLTGQKIDESDAQKRILTALYRP